MAASTYSRAFVDPDDFWRVRRLLNDTYLLTPPGFNWDVRRWDGWNCHNASMEEVYALRQDMRLWESGDRLVGVVHPDGPGEMVIEVHPDFRCLEADMIAWAEKHFAALNGQQRQIDTFVFEYDLMRQRLLQQRCFEKTTMEGVFYHMRLGDQPLSQAVLADGYHLRTTWPDEEDYARMAAILNAGFKRTIHSAAEYRNFATLSPSFRHDLNLVAETPEGAFAAHVGVTYEPVNRYGVFEPVCTHPDHLRRGLARALMFEGLHRLKALGAEHVYVGTGDQVAANKLYEAVGFTEVYRGYVWRKCFTG